MTAHSRIVHPNHISAAQYGALNGDPEGLRFMNGLFKALLLSVPCWSLIVGLLAR